MSKKGIGGVVSKIGTKVSCMAGMTGLKIKSKKPEILLVCGLVTMTGAVVSAVFAARKHDDIVEDHLERLEIAKVPVVVVEAMDAPSGSDVSDADGCAENGLENGAQNDGERNESGDLVRERSVKEIRKAVFKCYVVTTFKFIKNYALTGGLMAISAGFFVWMHNDQAGAIAGLSGAYMGLKEASERYEKRNIELNGIENHNMCKYGYKEVEVEEEDPDNGEKYTVKKKVPLKPGECECEDQNNEASEGDGDESLPSVNSSDFMNQFAGSSYYILFSKETAAGSFKGNLACDMNTINSAISYFSDIITTVRGWAIMNDFNDILGIERDAIGMRLGYMKGKRPVITWENLPYNADAVAGRPYDSILIEFQAPVDVIAVMESKRAEAKAARKAKGVKKSA